MFHTSWYTHSSRGSMFGRQSVANEYLAANGSKEHSVFYTSNWYTHISRDAMSVGRGNASCLFRTLVHVPRDVSV